MTKGRKIKLSVSLSADLVDRIDREAARSFGETRSSVMERWLRDAGRRSAESALASEVIAYYEALTPAERAEDERVARGLSAAARRVGNENGSLPPTRPGARRNPSAAPGRTAKSKRRR